MDPDATLREIQDLITTSRNADAVSDRVDALEVLANRVESLDQWLQGGGFLPEDWNTTAPDSSEPEHAIVESDRPAEIRAQLRRDPIIQTMADDLRHGLEEGEIGVDDVIQRPGQLKSSFLSNTLRKYRERGGKVPTHLSGPGEVVYLESLRKG